MNFYTHKHAFIKKLCANMTSCNTSAHITKFQLNKPDKVIESKSFVMRDPVSVKLVTFSSTKSFDSHQNLNDDSNSSQFSPIRQYPEYSQNTTLSNQTSESVPNDKVTSSPSSQSHQHHQNDVDVDQNSGSPTNSISIRTVKCQSIPMTKSDLDESLVREESSSSPITKYEQILPTKICDTDDGDESCPSRYDSLYRIVHHIIFRIITFLLIITDCVLLIVDLSIPAKAGNVQSVFNFLLIVLAIIFLIEIILRVHATRPNLFFSDWYNCLDFVIVLLNLPITVICILSNDKYGRLISVVRLVRAFRLIKIIRAVLIEPKNLQKSVRQTVSENKQRYRGEGFDLDLCYVTPRVIAMSFPASGSWTLFRNNIKDVARFFNLKHGIDFYKVYNLCSEKHYDPSSFQGRVASFPIDDHNVPSLEQMIEFVKDVRNWLDQDERHIIAVHCKGGKGRTGTMICSWLIYDKQFQDPKDALAYFAERRTDLTIGKKFQGVETPSQARYVGYFSQLVNSFGGKMPEKRLLYLKSINIEGISTIGAGNGSDISCSIVIDRDEVFNFDLGTEMNCSVFVNSGEDILIITPINCPLLRGDVRMKFNCRSKKVPQEYEKCAFYFWFNTAFVYDNFFTLSREDLDNPHKKKTWKIYTEKFKVTLHFSPQSPSSSA